MAQQTINIGASPNDGTGDPFRDAFDKCNDNFTELYAGLVGLLDFKGSTDCSANPNYPAASKGDFYVVSVAGKIGGASGVTVEVGDAYFALADNAGGTQASVGTSWTVIQGNILAGSFTAASTTEVLTGTDSSKGVTPDSLAALWEQGSDVASSGTISIGEGGYFNITGTTTITDIDFATDKAGREVWVKFAGILTLTHNASTLILPTGANITTAAGDTACFVSEGSDVVRCVAYQRASGSALVDATGGGGASGTSFPGSPSTGDLFYRTDRHIEYYYDGTRWLSTQMQSITISMQQSVAPSADFNYYAAIPFKGLYSIYLERFDVSGWRSAAGEWDFLLQHGTGNPGTYTTIATVDGSGHPTTTWFADSATIGAVLTSSCEVFRIVLDEVSGSATLIGAANISFRLVG